MQVFDGIAGSPGISIGEIYIFSQQLFIPKFSISDYQVEFEIDRFYSSLRKTKEEYQKLQTKLIKEMTEDEGTFFDAHIMMTEDQTLIQDVVNKLRSEKKNLEWVVYEVTESLYKKFLQLDDEYFRDRAVDMLDLGRKIIRILLSQKNVGLSNLEKEVIVVSSDISVSDTASMNKNYVLGFITELGGKTSHTAIIARSLAIPSVLGLTEISHKVTSGDIAIVDGFNGKFIVNPDEKTINDYKHLKENYDKRAQEYLSLKELDSETLDGRKITLKANMEIPEQEIESVLYYGASEVGLYRSEFLYLTKRKKVLPSEDQQYNAYKFILDSLKDMPVTIRTLDLGGDKILEDMNHREVNPNLGWRAIRFCLSNVKIFKTQLRALLRASVYGDLRIMLPMITNLSEVHETKKLIEEVKDELKEHNIKFNENIQIGIMIETPAAVLMSDILAKEVDFFSIGSNDLIQYILACDRGNEKISYLYEPLHPSVIKMIKMTIDNANENNIPVSLCGEMGSEMYNALVLIGMGLTELSVTPNKILELKKIIRNVNFENLKSFVENEVLNRKTQKEVIDALNKWITNNLKLE